jgi:putative ABC transport system permease protein
LTIRDLAGETLAGLLQRPGRSTLTMLGTVLGIGAFVAIIGLSETASGQISKQFNVFDATQVTVKDLAAQHAPTPRLDFPANADADAEQISGVVAAGVWWQVDFTSAPIAALPDTNAADSLNLPVIASSPGALLASGAKLEGGVLFNTYHQAHRQAVAVISAAAAVQLGITGLEDQPAIFIQGRPFTIIGVISGDARLPQFGLGVIVPSSTALADWGRPQPSAPAEMIVHTQLGAAQVVASEIALALRPDDPQVLAAAAPLSPSQLRSAVTSSLNGLFLVLAAIAVVIGALGIANTTLVAILERTSEIGLRRALGARPVHIAVQFLAESGTLGLLGGLVGAALGVAATLAVTLANHWTAVLDPVVVLLAPFAGAAVGLVAGLYPALRASTVEPAEALRR